MAKPGDNVQFMLELLKATGLDNDKPIIVSPSMSGDYALPLLFKHPEAFKAYIPVAPVGTQQYSDDQFKTMKVRHEEKKSCFFVCLFVCFCFCFCYVST